MIFSQAEIARDNAQFSMGNFINFFSLTIAY